MPAITTAFARLRRRQQLMHDAVMPFAEPPPLLRQHFAAIAAAIGHALKPSTPTSPGDHEAPAQDDAEAVTRRAAAGAPLPHQTRCLLARERLLAALPTPDTGVAAKNVGEGFGDDQRVAQASYASGRRRTATAALQAASYDLERNRKSDKWILPFSRTLSFLKHTTA